MQGNHLTIVLTLYLQFLFCHFLVTCSPIPNALPSISSVKCLNVSIFCSVIKKFNLNNK